MRFKDTLKQKSEEYHGEIHLLLGVVTALVVNLWSGGNLLVLLMVSVAAAFFPDIDHLFYLFTYGRNSNYSIEARKVLFSGGFLKYIEYAKKNHKNNTGIISHNILSFIFVILLIFLVNSNPVWTAFFVSITFHFFFDMFEDLLFFGKLNGNWWLKFNRPRE